MIKTTLYSFMAAVNADKLPQANLDQSSVNTVLKLIFLLTSAISLLVITLAGFRYTISRGDPNNIKSSKETIIYAIIGLIISLGAYGIVSLVYGNVT